MDKSGRISLVFLLVLFILSLIFIPFNSQVSAATSSDCVAGKGYGVKVALDPEHIKKTYETAKFKPSEISPYDNINCNIWVKKECSLTVQNIKTKLVIGEGVSEILSNSSVPFSKTENNTDIYLWKIEGFNWSYADKGQNPYIGWINDKKIMESLIDQGNATCIANITFTNGDSPLVNDTFDLNTCLKLYGLDDAKFSINYYLGKTVDFNYYSDVFNFIPNQNINKTDPFKTYIDKFSFFVDLKKKEESKYFSISLDEHIASPLYDRRFVFHHPKTFVKDSSCKDSEYRIFVHQYPKVYPGYMNGGEKFIYVTLDHLKSDLLTITHEFGHDFCGLTDEYDVIANNEANPVDEAKEKLKKVFDSSSRGGNCKSHSNPWQSRYGDFIYGCDKQINYVRPSLNSIMQGVKKESRMNVISCAYCLYYLNEDKNKDLSPYLEECLWMDTVIPTGVDER